MRKADSVKDFLKTYVQGVSTTYFCVSCVYFKVKYKYMNFV